MTDASQVLPDELDFTDQDIKEDIERPQLRPNTWYLGRIMKSEIAVNDSSGNISIRMMVAPLDQEKKTRSPTTRYQVVLPFSNSAIPGHKKPSTFRFLHDFLNALAPDKYPRYPRYDKGDQVWYTADGRVIEDKEEFEEEKAKIAREVREEGKRLYKNVTDVEGEELFFKTENNDYRSVDKVSATPPEDRTVVYEDFKGNEPIE